MGKMIDCKSCGKQISREAKMCPHCGRDLKNSIWGSIFFIACICYLLAVGCNIFYIQASYQEIIEKDGIKITMKVIYNYYKEHDIVEIAIDAIDIFNGEIPEEIIENFSNNVYEKYAQIKWSPVLWLSKKWLIRPDANLIKESFRLIKEEKSKKPKNLIEQLWERVRE